MRRRLAGDYELDDDRERLDHDAIFAYLHEEAYWHRWRARADVDRQARSADADISRTARLRSTAQNRTWQDRTSSVFSGGRARYLQLESPVADGVEWPTC
jgi:hypothetical protein